MKRMKRRPCATDVAMGKTDVEHRLDFGGFFLILSLIFHLPLRLERIEMCGVFFLSKLMRLKRKLLGKKTQQFLIICSFIQNQCRYFNGGMAKSQIWQEELDTTFQKRFVTHQVIHQVDYLQGLITFQVISQKYSYPVILCLSWSCCSFTDFGYVDVCCGGIPSTMDGLQTCRSTPKRMVSPGTTSPLQEEVVPG